MDGDQETSVAPSSSVTAKKKKNGSIRSIFMHANTADLFLMVLGVFGSLDDGFTTPLILFISSRLMNNVGSSSTVGPTSFTHSINKNAMNMLYLAAGSFFACFLRLSRSYWSFLRLAIVGFPFVVLLMIPGLLYGRTSMGLARKIREEYNQAGTIAEQENWPPGLQIPCDNFHKLL